MNKYVDNIRFNEKGETTKLNGITLNIVRTDNYEKKFAPSSNEKKKLQGIIKVYRQHAENFKHSMEIDTENASNWLFPVGQQMAHAKR